MEQATQRPGETGVAEFAALNDEFHQTILTAAACEPLTAALEPALQVQLVLLQRYRQTLHEHLERSCWHHREIIRAIEARDAELAEAQMRLHLLSARGGTPGRKASDRGARHSASVSALRGRAASQRKRAASKHRA
jgi:DNA-binding GntR family transcriptional regulator